MRNLLMSAIVVLSVVLSVSACSTVKEYQAEDDFTKKTEDFVLRMKWSDFIGASLHFQGDMREEFLERFEDWDTLKVVEVTMSRVKSELDGDTARKIAYYRFEYYLLNEMTVHKEKVELIWELSAKSDEKGAYWRIVEPFPELEIEKK